MERELSARWMSGRRVEVMRGRCGSAQWKAEKIRSECEYMSRPEITRAPFSITESRGEWKWKIKENCVEGFYAT